MSKRWKRQKQQRRVSAVEVLGRGGGSVAQYTLNLGGGRVCVTPYSLPVRRASLECNNLFLVVAVAGVELAATSR